MHLVSTFSMLTLSMFPLSMSTMSSISYVYHVFASIFYVYHVYVAVFLSAMYTSRPSVPTMATIFDVYCHALASRKCFQQMRTNLPQFI
uniref:Secreted protein n=1 Tax=Rhipicephalus microplus TaxID=6941 RepID=A0A6G5A433_RHIMP